MIMSCKGADHDDLHGQGWQRFVNFDVHTVLPAVRCVRTSSSIVHALDFFHSIHVALCNWLLILIELLISCMHHGLCTMGSSVLRA